MVPEAGQWGIACINRKPVKRSKAGFSKEQPTLLCGTPSVTSEAINPLLLWIPHARKII